VRLSASSCLRLRAATLSLACCEAMAATSASATSGLFGSSAVDLMEGPRTLQGPVIVQIVPPPNATSSHDGGIGDMLTEAVARPFKQPPDGKSL
jgi:hypothetical protein